MKRLASIRRVMLGTAAVAAFGIATPTMTNAQATTDPNTGATTGQMDDADDDGFDMGWLGLLGLAGLLGLRKPAHTTVHRDTTTTGRH
jgi:MYXO-CTERM domain-containing protein